MKYFITLFFIINSLNNWGQCTEDNLVEWSTIFPEDPSMVGNMDFAFGSYSGSNTFQVYVSKGYYTHGALVDTRCQISSVFLDVDDSCCLVSSPLFEADSVPVDGAVEFVDLNNDGQLDLLIAGIYPGSYDGGDINYWYLAIDVYINEERILKIRKPGIDFSTCGIGDFDDDGDYDFHVNGNIYENNFPAFQFNGKHKDQYMNTVWSDDYPKSINCELNGDPTGKDRVTEHFICYDSDINSQPPSMPTAPSVNLNGDGYAYLTWGQAYDSDTPDSLIHYNVFLGTEPLISDKITTHSLTNGNRTVLTIGNAGYNTQKRIKIEDDIIYYWGVQAIDEKNNTSTFLEADSFIRKSANYEFIGEFHENIGGDANVLFDGYGNPHSYYGGWWKSDVWYWPLSNFGLYGFGDISIEFNDFDNDHIMDMVSIADDGDNYRIYVGESRYNPNLDISNSYAIPSPTTNNGSFKAISTFDIDNDGDIDLYCSPNIYLNQGNRNFIIIDTLDLADCSVAGDLDNDSDIDLVLNSGVIYENVNGHFIKHFEYAKLQFGDIDLGDYDNDGDLDILAVGDSLETPYSLVLRNNGNLNFETMGYDIYDVGKGHIYSPWGGSIPGKSYCRWADYNNDGLLDIFISGSGNQNNSFFGIYENNGINGFILKFQSIADYNLAPFIIGDFYDWDGDLDLIVFGSEGKAYKNTANVSVNYPGTPENLVNYIEGSTVYLTWDKTIHSNEVDEGLTYNLRVGSSSGGVDIISPLSSYSIGQERNVVDIGAQGTNSSWKLRNLEPGTYYWAVQAINHSYRAGGWSEEGVFTIPEVSANFDADTVCEGLQTSFQDLSITSLDSITSWKWFFGDGDSSTLKNPKHVYPDGGIYSVTLITAVDSISHSFTKQVKVYHAPIANFSTSMVCHGKKTIFTDLSITDSLTVDSYLWDFGFENYSNTTQGGTEFTYPHAGEYTTSLTILSAEGCVSIDTMVTTVAAYPDLTLSLNEGDMPGFCTGDSASLLTDHVPEYAYQWLLNDQNISATNSQLTVKNTGVYSIQVTNPLANCIDTTNAITIQVHNNPDQPVISTSEVSGVICEGDSIVLSVPEVEEIIYNWKYENGGSMFVNTPLLTVKESGQFFVEITDTNNCTALSTDTVSVTVNSLPTNTLINREGNLNFCEGDSSLLFVEYVIGCTYQWFSNGGLLTGETSNELIVSTSGEYSIEVTNSEECTTNSTNNVPIQVYLAPEAPGIDTEDSISICIGDSAHLTANYINGLTYSWQRNNIPDYATTSDVYVKNSGLFKLLVTSVNGCSSFSNDSVVVKTLEQPEPFTIELDGIKTFCQGKKASLNVNHVIANGYQWYLDDEKIPGAIGKEIEVEEQGDYSVIVSNLSNCATKSTKPVHITVYPKPQTPQIIPQGKTEFCEGETVVLSSNITDKYHYWITFNNATIEDEKDYSASNTGYYRTFIKNEFNCYSDTSESVFVQVKDLPDKPEITSYPSKDFCSGDTISLVINHRQDSLTYYWYNRNGFYADVIQDSLKLSDKGSFCVRAVNSQNCISVSDSIVTQKMDLPDIPELSEVEDSYCPGERIPIQVLNYIDGYSYQWLRNGNKISSAIGDSIYRILDEAEYSVKVINGQCEKLSESRKINLKSELQTPELLVYGPVVWYFGCSNDSAKTYKWYYNNELVAGNNDYIYVANKKHGQYYVKVTGNDDCVVQSKAITIPTSDYKSGNELLLDESVTIWPNPNNGAFNLSIESSYLGNIHISLISGDGKIIKKENINKRDMLLEHNLSFDDLACGIYYLSVRVGDNTAIEKLIIDYSNKE